MATLWSGGDVILRQGIQFVTLALLARMLSPSDFGLIAMLSLITGTATVLVDGGLSAALIQRRQITPTDESTIFYFNLAVGSLLTLLVIVSAPWIAAFYHTPELVTPARIMAFSCLFGALAPVHTALLTRKLDFATQAKAGTFAAITSGLTVIFLAKQGMGITALALHSVLMAGLMSAALWGLHPWRPRTGFSRGSLSNLTRFGAYHMGAGLLDMIYNRLHTPLLGRLFGARELGLYAHADTTRQLPGNFLGSMIARVALPMFSASSDDPIALRRGLQISIRAMMLVNAPVMLGMSVLASLLLPSLFGLHWQAAAPLLSILCLAGILHPLHVLNVQILLSQGHARLVFRLEIAKKLTGLVLLLGGLYFGLHGVAWSQVALSMIALCMNTWYTHRLLDYGLARQLREALPCIGAAVAASGLVLLWRHIGPQSPTQVQQLMCEAALGASGYILLAFAFRFDALRDALSLFHLILRPRSNPDVR